MSDCEELKMLLTFGNLFWKSLRPHLSETREDLAFARAQIEWSRLLARPPTVSKR